MDVEQMMNMFQQMSGGGEYNDSNIVDNNNN